MLVDLQGFGMSLKITMPKPDEEVNKCQRRAGFVKHDQFRKRQTTP
jgi:hypothetical protein